MCCWTCVEVKSYWKYFSFLTAIHLAVVNRFRAVILMEDPTTLSKFEYRFGRENGSVKFEIYVKLINRSKSSSPATSAKNKNKIFVHQIKTFLSCQDIRHWTSICDPQHPQKHTMCTCTSCVLSSNLCICRFTSTLVFSDEQRISHFLLDLLRPVFS